MTPLPTDPVAYLSSLMSLLMRQATRSSRQPGSKSVHLIVTRQLCTLQLSADNCAPEQLSVGYSNLYYHDLPLLQQRVNFCLSWYIVCSSSFSLLIICNSSCVSTMEQLESQHPSHPRPHRVSAVAQIESPPRLPHPPIPTTTLQSRSAC